MLRAENISFRVDRKTLLHASSLSFEEGKFHVIMGANGAGKSTLMKLLAGSQPCSTGTVFLNEKSLGQYNREELARERAVLSQHYNISFPISAHDIVMMGRYPFFNNKPRETDRSICEHAIRLVKMEAFAERDFNTLSGGESQKIQMCRVLAQIWDANAENPKLLFLDEPVSHLDIKYQHQLLRVAKESCEKHVTVIAILHDINLALHYADRILFMKEGQLKYETHQPAQVSPEIIKDIFDVNARILHPGGDDRPVVVF
ncbi:MAG TPA: heme ABC transporter ATP-binding protein [Chitinophagaceae bacterium]|nr:heme ABC transporter ATP-binding protein [Chitinophagaceae bacterium]